MADDQFAGFEEVSNPITERQEVADPQPTEDEFAGFEPIVERERGIMEGINTLARRGTGAFLQGAPPVAGTIAGAQIGMLGGPAAPVTVPLMAGVGFISGVLAGDELAEIAEGFGLAETSIDKIPKDLRPFGVAGEVIGGSVPFLGAPLVAAKTGARLPSSFAGDYINSIIESAGRRPGAFALKELGAVGGAATGGAVAETAFPGNTPVRIGSEIVGGLVRPTERILSASHTAIGTVIKRLSPAGRQSEAAKILTQYVEAAGEDPQLLARLLREPVEELEGIELNAAQQTGSKALGNLVADLRQSDTSFNKEISRQAEEALESSTRAILLLEQTGDPQALRAAAELRSFQFKSVLRARLNQAEDNVRKAAEAVSPDTPAARAQLSKTAREEVTGVLKRAREHERGLWGEVPGNIVVGPDGIQTTLARFSKMSGEMLERERIPDVIEGTINDLIDAKDVLTRVRAGEQVSDEVLTQASKRLSLENLLKLRGRALALARETDSANESRIYGEVADAVLEDIGKIGGEAGTLIDNARRYSRELNDVFTRSFVGESQARHLPPEVFLKSAFASGEEMGELQMRQISEATSFLADRGVGTALDEQSIETVFDAQERIIRLMGAEAVERNPATGVVEGVNLLKLRSMMTKNEELLNRFPEARALFEDAIQTEAGRKALEAQVTRAFKFVDQKSMAAKVLKIDVPADAIRGAIKSQNPIRQVKSLIRLAKKGGDDAVAGLRTAIWEDAFRSATAKGGRLSIPDLISAIDDPIRPGHPSIINIMRQEGIIAVEEVQLIRQFVQRSRNILAAAQSPGTGQPVLAGEDMIVDTALRVAGSRAASFFVQGQTGPQLIAAARGSAAARRIFEKVPVQKVQNLLQAALRGDPIRPGAQRFSLLATLLEQPGNSLRGEQALRQVHAYAVQALAFGIGDYHIEGEEP